jgi:hypothetical protein
MMPGKPKGQIDMAVLEELADFLSKRGGSEGPQGEESGEEGAPALEVEIGAAPAVGGEDMETSGACPHCGKPY